ncbi:Circadian-associated transcriptional repressor [Oryzias melastigma]|uniref:Circadian-associated transcriptional repressor n=1 Tax=Oryzias melastigma TaxID=30732 RepID=A0A834C553_ORYME|nr:Circadian-associated transcriptional repressor [Oryzias melastigma]
MNPLGASSKWPSYDSLRSNSSFLPSEGEQTEDEADVFSEPEGDGGKKVCLLSDEDVSRPYLRFGSNQLYERDPPGLDIPDRYPAASASPGAAELGSSLQTPGDLAFAQKCADLHRFIHPLFELLHGLKMGRFDKGLNGFQQSVAIDRLQKILGILQRPEMGEKYLQNLLQIEMLLKAWFPQRALKSTNRQTPPSTLTPHWHQNQLHMPVKKRKLSWPDPRDAGGVPAKRKHHQQEHGRCDAPPLTAAATCLPPSPKKQTPPGEERPHLTGGRRDAGQTLTDSHCRVIRWLWSNGKHQNPNPELPSCESPAMQDSSVSSSNGAAAALLNQQ